MNGGDGLATIGTPLNGEWHLTQSDGADGPVTDRSLLHGGPPRVVWRERAAWVHYRRLSSTTRPRGTQSDTAACRRRSGRHGRRGARRDSRSSSPALRTSASVILANGTCSMLSTSMSTGPTRVAPTDLDLGSLPEPECHGDIAAGDVVAELLAELHDATVRGGPSRRLSGSGATRCQDRRTRSPCAARPASTRHPSRPATSPRSPRAGATRPTGPGAGDGDGETRPSDHADRLGHSHRCYRTPGCVDLGHRLTRSQDGIAVQRAVDALHQRVTGIDRGCVGAEGSARLPEDRSDDGHDLPADVLLCCEEIAALRGRIGARLDADDPVLPQVEVCIEDGVGHSERSPDPARRSVGEPGWRATPRPGV